METFRKPSSYKNVNSTSTKVSSDNIENITEITQITEDTVNYCPETESWIGRVVAGISSLVI